MVVAGRSKNVGMPIAMLLHTDGAHERPGGKEMAFIGVFPSPLCANLQSILCLLNFVFTFVVILLTDIWGIIFHRRS